MIASPARLRKLSIASSLLVSAILLSACASEISERRAVVLPGLIHYSPEFQDKLASEIEGEPLPPCGPVDLGGPCSAMKRATIDYGTLREQIRAAEPLSP